ncbi:TetR/AcrR family transcriptional regulator [Deinococcus cellulosilyticus]|uniref:TetR family transcriptional regulator n=1 Tax=Deinococcus cellulosilyticus (strain DSM 18568 / NBRC 106333 / KACC 11606 / 5516J-15) TaxID=1223518 RepID=A0A511N5I5_DEIC1|nr:TetR/AcrR family transcriptional regulator [Deinococcus cellulosilyticus]GEM48122.1 TetR family transcriptional regulator [Deinococcus cellulosilyticus NBRC 106333 = KACC 11606]
MKTAEKTEDRRIQRTRDLLKCTLVQLIEKQGYEGISVQDLTREANMGRATFYLHYKDKHDLLWQSLKAPLEDLRERFPNSGAALPEEPSPMLRALFELAAQEKLLFKTALEVPSAMQVGQHIRAYIAGFFLNRIRQDVPDSAEPQLAAEFLAGGILSVLQWWLGQEEPQDAFQITLLLKQLAIQPVFQGLSICQE